MVGILEEKRFLSMSNGDHLLKWFPSKTGPFMGNKLVVMFSLGDHDTDWKRVKVGVEKRDANLLWQSRRRE